MRWTVSGDVETGWENAPLVHSPWGPETAASAEEAVSADGDGGVVGGGGGARGRRGGDGSGQVAADHNLGLDDCLAAEHDVLRADEGGFSGDLVARVLGELAGVYEMVGEAYRLNILSSWGSSRHGGGGGGDLRLNQGYLAVRRVFVAVSDVLRDPCRPARALQSALPVVQLPLKYFPTSRSIRQRPWQILPSASSIIQSFPLHDL